LGEDLGAPPGGDLHLRRAGDATVVIKVVPASRLAPGERDRLGATVRALAGLAGPSPPALAAPLALGEEGAGVYRVRRYVPGVTLAQRLAAGRLAAPEALGVAASILEALRAAHDRDVLHLDVKPGNVVVAAGPPGRSEGAVLVDFGLARSGRLGALGEGG